MNDADPIKTRTRDERHEKHLGAPTNVVRGALTKRAALDDAAPCDAGVRSGGSRRPQRQQRDARDRISAAIKTACSGRSGPRLQPLGATTRPWTVDAAALNLAERELMHTRSVTRG